MVDITEVAPRIYLIDNRVYGMPGAGSSYLLNEDRKALVEVGPPTSVPAVLDGIRKAGISPAEIDYVIVTHIHLDHGGGAGLILRDMPKARVVVHQRGAWHMANPGKLVRGMMETQGEEYYRQCGEVVPVPASRLMPVDDDDTITLSGNQVLRFIDAPGHAPHHLCIRESRSGGVFCAEAAGTLLRDGKIFFPFNTPPSFDLEHLLATIGKIRELIPTRLYFSHFGASDRAAERLDMAAGTARRWDEMVSGYLREGATPDVISGNMARLFQDQIDLARDTPSLYRFIKANISVCVAAYLKYYRDRSERK